MKIDFGGQFSKLTLSLLLLSGYVTPATAQFKLQQDFKGTAAPGWTLSGSAILTAPSIDAAASGWLRLTDTGGTEKGLALNNAFSFAGNVPVTLEFDYVSWGGSGADGMTLFLYDPTIASPMAGATTGGGLGYCGGAGGYLGIGIDEYGNFSNPADKCSERQRYGPGFQAGVVGDSRPVQRRQCLDRHDLRLRGHRQPACNDASIFEDRDIHAHPRGFAGGRLYDHRAVQEDAGDQPFQTIAFSNVSFPYAPPANLSVGLSGSTGGSTNILELHGLGAATPDDLQVTMTGPSAVLQGASVSYIVTVTNNGNYPLGGADSPTILDSVPASITGVAWTCAASSGASCDASGTGNLSTRVTNVTLPAKRIDFLHDHRHAGSRCRLRHGREQFSQRGLRQRHGIPGSR